MAAVSELLASLAANPYFSAGFGLFGLGGLAAAGRIAGKVAVAAGKRRLLTTLQVNKRK